MSDYPSSSSHAAAAAPSSSKPSTPSTRSSSPAARRSPRSSNNHRGRQQQGLVQSHPSRGGGGGPPSAPRRRRSESPSSFASATASSLRHGGPAGACPPPSARGRRGGGASAILPPSLPRISTANVVGKENATSRESNRDDRRHRFDGASSSTPTKKPTRDEGGGATADHRGSPPSPAAAAILSPTPYWKVLEGRGGDGTMASPRETRSSAAKKGRATAAAPGSPTRGPDGLADEEGGENDDDDDDDDGRDGGGDYDGDGTASILLRFKTPPDRRLQMQSARNAKRRRDAEIEAERLRQERIRRRGEASMSRGLGEIEMGGGVVVAARGAGGRRAPKRARRDAGGNGGSRRDADPTMRADEDEDYDDDDLANEDDSRATPAATSGTSTEDIRRIVEESLAGHESSRVEGLVARNAMLERDAAHRAEMHEVLRSKYDALKSRVEIGEGSGCELRMALAERQEIIERLEGEVRRLEAEKGEAQARRVAEREALERERGEAETELARAREAHAVEVERVLDEAASSKGARDRDSERFDAAEAELASARTQVEEANRRNERLEAENGAAREGLMRRISDLERVEADLTSILRAEERDNDSNRAIAAELRSDASSHASTVARLEGSVSHLEEEVRSVTKALDNAKREMEGMQSPRSRDALEREYCEEVSGLEGKLTAMEGERLELENKLREINDMYEAVRSKLDAAVVERGELTARLGDASGAVEEAKAEAAKLDVEVQHLSDEVRAAHAKCKENEGMLEEMADENEQLLARLEATQGEMELRVQEAKNCAEGEVRQLASKYDTASAEKDVLVEELRLARDEVADLQARMGILDEALVTSQQCNTSHQANKIASDRKLTEVSSQLQSLTDHLESARSTITILKAKLHAKDEYCEQFESIERRLVEEKRVLNEIRANLHNRVIQLSGNIRVFVRVRPLIEGERRLTTEVQQHEKYNWSVGGSGRSSRPSSRDSMGPTGGRPPSRESGEDADDESCPFHFPSITDRNTRPSSSGTGGVGAKSSANYTSFNDLTKQVIELTEPHKDRGGLKERRKKWKYGFDRVFSQDHGQDDVWEAAEPLVQSCVDGFHVCMFAYGQTGSGKTHTMIGVAGNRGLIPRAVAKLFEAKREIERSGQELVNISVEMLEIYNEEVRDLLEYKAGPDGQLIKLKLSSNEAVGNVKINARDEREVEGILKLAQERRCVKATKVNAESSRSHLLFTVHFNGSSTDDASTSGRSGCLHIIDLAGSERLDKSGSHGALLTEAKHINTSLSALALVIEKLQAKKNSDSEHIPYRDSKLTYLLRNSLGGDSKTLAIVCCSPHQAHFNESLNSIRFAAKASKVELKEGNTVDV